MYTILIRVKPLLIAAAVGIMLSLLPFTVSMADTDRPQSVYLNVPFAMQVPTGEWNDPRQKDGCEEASSIMAMAWVRGGSVPAEEVRRDIINMSEYENVLYGFFEDTSAQDTATLIRNYYQHTGVTVTTDITTEHIKTAIANNHPVIIPINTRFLHHPLYRNGPIRHTVIVVGYDEALGEIVIHDPLYKNGAYVHVSETQLDTALWNYDSGVHLPLPEHKTAMIEIWK